MTDLLDGLDEDIPSTDEAPAPRRRSSFGPPGATPGVCATCGQPARSPRAFYCDTHTTPAAASRGKGRRRTTRRASSSAPKRPTSRQIAQQIELLYSMGGGVMVARGHERPGAAVLNQAPACADAWAQCMDQYPRLRELMERATAAGGVFALAVAHLPIIQAAQLELIEARARAQAAA